MLTKAGGTATGTSGGRLGGEERGGSLFEGSVEKDSFWGIARESLLEFVPAVSLTA